MVVYEDRVLKIWQDKLGIGPIKSLDWVTEMKF